MSIVLKHKQKAFWGKPITMCNVGKQTPSEEDGTFTIENDEHAHALVADGIGVEYAEESLNPKAPELEEDSEPELDENGEVVEKKKAEPETEKADFTEDELAALKEDYSKKLRKDLEAECTNYGFPGGEWRGKNKEQLVEYIMSKL